MATHNRLRGKPDGEWVDGSRLGVPSGALAMAFPHSAHLLSTFPRQTQGGPSAGEIVYKAGLEALEAAGGDRLLPLVGLRNRDAIAKN